MGSRAPRTQIVDLTGDEIADSEEAGVPLLAHCNQDRIESGQSRLRLSQTAGPITRCVVFYFDLTSPTLVQRTDLPDFICGT